MRRRIKEGKKRNLSQNRLLEFLVDVIICNIRAPCATSRIFILFFFTRNRRRKVPLSVAPFWRISCLRQIPESRDIFLSTFQVFLFAYFIRRISFYCTRRTARPLHPTKSLNVAQGGKKLNYTLFIAAARCACAPLRDNEMPLWNCSKKHSYVIARSTKYNFRANTS